MDFNPKDIRHFLLESIPLRFKSLSPPEFQNFISYLFEEDGFELLPVDAAAQQAGVIKARKDDSTHLIIPVLKDENDPVAEEFIYKVLDLQDVHEMEQTWIITTSSFSPESTLLAEENDIEMWDWDALYEALCAQFFESKSHLEYQQAHPFLKAVEEVEPDLKMKAKWQAAEGVGTEWYNLGITITNPTARNVYVHLELPALIDTKKNQIMADEWVDGEFVSGMIYSGASMRTNALFNAAKIGDRPSGGRIILTCHERLEMPVTYHLECRLQGQACYVVTYCYTVNSPEYYTMTKYRDEVLARTIIGRGLIGLYYFISSRLVQWASVNQMVDRWLRRSASMVIPTLMQIARRSSPSKSK